ncbi:MAG: hypothetical protein MZV70_26170 [Desulfobacterales bacterium]|nr:hypothetical protein [Desulfobacterales bacterium]
MLNDGNFFFPIPEEWLPFSLKMNSAYRPDDGESDYIYLTENMAVIRRETIHAPPQSSKSVSSAHTVHPVNLYGANNSQDAMTILQHWQEESVVTAQTKPILR